MPTWPSGSIPTTNLDAGSDSPGSARADLKQTVDQVNQIRTARGVADGIAALDSAGTVPASQLPALLGLNAVMSWADAGTHSWTIPAGVTKVLAICTGAGGGGGYSANDGLEANGSHGGGGGAGGTAFKFFAVTPGETVTIVVGAAGSGGSSVGPDDDGGDGGDSSISIGTPPRSITGEGGTGGFGGGTAYGGAPGNATGGDFNIIGGAGLTGHRKGGDGGASFWQGGSIANSSVNALYGGGGGQGSGSPGGDGKWASRGLCVIMY